DRQGQEARALFHPRIVPCRRSTSHLHAETSSGTAGLAHTRRPLGHWLAPPNTEINEGTSRDRTTNESSRIPTTMVKANSRNGTSATTARRAKLPAMATPATAMARLARGTATRTASRSGRTLDSSQVPNGPVDGLLGQGGVAGERRGGAVQPRPLQQAGHGPVEGSQRVHPADAEGRAVEHRQEPGRAPVTRQEHRAHRPQRHRGRP